MAETTPTPASEPVITGSTEGSGKRANRGVLIRAAVYVIGFHVFAAFILLLMLVGNRNH